MVMFRILDNLINDRNVKSTFKEWNSMMRYFLNWYGYQHRYLLKVSNTILKGSFSQIPQCQVLNQRKEKR